MMVKPLTDRQGGFYAIRHPRRHGRSAPTPPPGHHAPIYQTTTYVLDEVGKTKGFDYSALPTHPAGAGGGLAAVEGRLRSGLRSGLSAVDASSASSRRRPCGGLRGYVRGVTRFWNSLQAFRLECSYVDTTDAAAWRRHTPIDEDAVVETPSNPNLRITDLEAMRGSPAGITSSSPWTHLRHPVFLRSFDFGADLVVESTTKYLSGHNQIIAAPSSSTTAASMTVCASSKASGRAAPLDCYLTF